MGFFQPWAPRQRKTVLAAAAANDENKENENRKKRKKGEATASGSDEEEEEPSDEEQETPPKKKSKKGEDKIHGFTDNEIRRFVKSYKKYPLPLTRMEDIAEDADLTDKSVNDLVELGRRIRERCLAALEESGGGTNSTANAAEEKKAKVAAVKVGNVPVNAKTLLETEKLLRPLGKLLPPERTARRSWRLDTSVKDAHFDVDWTLEDDSRLLIGLYEYGLGSWEQASLLVRVVWMDPALIVSCWIRIQKNFHVLKCWIFFSDG
jgi:hypothetical protein